MKRTLMLAGLVACVMLLSLRAPAIEPYPFKDNPREFPKTEYLRVDFEGTLPPGAELGEGVTIETEMGTGKSIGLVSRQPGLIMKVPIMQYDLDRCRFDLTFDYGGKNFGYVSAKLVASNKEGKELRDVGFGAEWCYTGMRTRETVEQNLEFDNIYSVALVLTNEDRARWETKEGDRTVQLDNIVLRRHEARVIYASRARSELENSLRDEGLEVERVGDLFIASNDERQSFFDFARYKESDSLVRSHWQKRVHIGTTYKVTRAKMPSFVLGVQARQAALETAAAAQKKSLVEMYEYFLDDVASHGFNTVWVDFTKELEKFDELAAKRDIYVILRDPNWSELEKWIAKPNDPMPDEFKTKAAENLAKYAKMKSLLSYDMDRPLSPSYEPMLAKAREYVASIAPNVQIATEQSDIYASEAMIQPYAHMGIQTAAFHHYIGRPWGGVSHMYHPNYWITALTEGYYRRIHDGFEVRYMPSLIAIPTGRRFGKKVIDFQVERVDPKVNNWVYDNETKRWSGWYRYKYPPMLMRALVWKAVQSGAGGLLFQEWGPATISHTVTGSEILNDSKYRNAYYEPDMLRQADMSESPAWRELGEIGREFAKYRLMMADTTRHGNNTARSNSGNVRVATLTGRQNPFKLICVVNTRVGEYDEKDLTIDPDTGELKPFSFAAPETIVLTVDQDAGLIDLATGESVTPTETSTTAKWAKYDITLGPGEGRMYFRGARLTYINFMSRYKIPIEKKSANPREAGAFGPR